MESVEQAGLAKALSSTINSQGHAFQFGVLAQLERARIEHVSDWEFRVAEFPVQARGFDTRIDLVLEHRELPVSLVVECKRVNPRLGRWAFLRAPKIRRGVVDERFIFEQVKSDGTGHVYSNGATTKTLYENVVHLGYTLPIRSAESEAETPARRTDIEDAASQVSKGVSGLVNFYAEASALRPMSRCIVPVIVTTAELYVADVNLEDTNTTTGAIEVAPEKVNRANMILLQYPVSVGIGHGRFELPLSTDLAQALDQAYVRTIPVISTASPTLWESINRIAGFFRVDLPRPV